MDVTITYEEAVENFNSSLLTNLRGHGAQEACLEGWVPDADPVFSILNMVEAAEAAGLPGIGVHFTGSSLDAAQRQQLLDQVGRIGPARLTADQDGFLLSVALES